MRENRKVVCLEKLQQRGMYQLIAGLTGDVTAYELAVHTYAFAGDLQHPHMSPCHLLEALLHQVPSMYLLILADAATEQIIGVYRRSHIRQKFQTKSLASEKVELAVLQ